jgi:hypothetical protein
MADRHSARDLEPCQAVRLAGSRGWGGFAHNSFGVDTSEPAEATAVHGS